MKKQAKSEEKTKAEPIFAEELQKFIEKEISKVFNTGVPGAVSVQVFCNGYYCTVYMCAIDAVSKNYRPTLEWKELGNFEFMIHVSEVKRALADVQPPFPVYRNEDGFALVAIKA